MITVEFVVLFLAFSIPLVCTPGPGNLILAMSGARWGLRGTIPLIAGIDMAYLVFSVAIGSGLGQLFAAYPASYTVLKYGGGIYLVYLASRIWQLRPGSGDRPDLSMGFWDGVVLTALNPKAHILMILMFSQFMRPDSGLPVQILVLTLSLALVNIPNHFAWGYLGEMISKRAGDARNSRTANRIFALMLLGVAVYILAG